MSLAKKHSPSPACGGESGVAHLDEFHLLIQDMGLQEATEIRVCVLSTQGLQIRKGLPGSGSSPDSGSFHGALSFTPLIWARLQHAPEENAATVLVLHL